RWHDFTNRASCDNPQRIYPSRPAQASDSLHGHASRTSCPARHPFGLPRHSNWSTHRYRNPAEFENLVGCFINMVAVRNTSSENMTFLDVLARVRENALAAFSHSQIPFSEVVRKLHPRRAANRTPIFQVQLVFQSYPMPDVDWPGLNVRRFAVDTGTSKFDLSVLVEMKDAVLEVGFEYN